MDKETNPGGSRLPVLSESSSTSSSCTVCSISHPTFEPIASSHGEAFCLSYFRYALIEERQDGHQEPAIQDSESSHEGDLDVDSADDIDELKTWNWASESTRRARADQAAAAAGSKIIWSNWRPRWYACALAGASESGGSGVGGWSHCEGETGNAATERLRGL